MKLVNLLFAVVGAVLVTAVAVTESAHATVWAFSCDGERVFTWQAMVTDPAGNPIPDGDYQLIYCYYEDSSGMDLIGCCTTIATVGASKHGLKSVAAAGGLAKAMLNYAQPIWEDTFMVGRAPRLPSPGYPYPWLEMTFESETMSPLTRITGVPDAGTSRRMRGDFYSAKGRAMIVNDTLVTSGIVDLVTNSSTAALVLYSSSEDTLPKMMMEATDSGSTVTLLDMTGNTTISLTGAGAGTFDDTLWTKTGFKFPDGSFQTTAATGGACNWSVTDSVLSTNNYWGIARGGVGNILYGDSVHTMVNLGVACTTGIDFFTYYYLTVSGGFGNRAGTEYSTVGGGRQNAAMGSGSTIGGGEQNTANGWRSTIGGGYSNTIHGRYGGISSGYSNLAGDEVLDTAAFVGGGSNNSAIARYATVAGGTGNTADDWASTVSGGNANTATANNSTVGGGFSNNATGQFSTIPGGSLVDASGDYSFAAGRKAKAVHDGAFVWADHTDAEFSSTASDQFLIRAAGGVGIGTSNVSATLDVNSSNDALRLRAGEHQSGSTKNQILFSFNGGLNYTHAIKSRHRSGTDDDNAIDFYVWDFGTDANEEIGTKHIMTLIGTGTGRVGIGTTNPAYKLDVDGDINVSGSYNVKKNGSNYNHPDYVFEPEYELMSLDKLRKYVYEHKHLPNVISADEVRANDGFKLDELLIQMLEKIEEQTLYILQLEQEKASVQALNDKTEEINELKVENAKIKAQLSQLTTLVETVLANQKNTDDVSTTLASGK